MPSLSLGTINTTPVETGTRHTDAGNKFKPQSKNPASIVRGFKISANSN